MTHQFENTEATKLEDETVSELTAEQKSERIAEKAAAKLAKTQHKAEDAQEGFTI